MNNATSRWWRKVAPELILLIPLALALLAYVGVLSYPFIYDDIGQIVKNQHIQAWSYLPQYFTRNVWSQFNAVSNYYRPAFLVWLLLSYKTFGLNPAAWHAVSVVLHAIVTGLVYLLAVHELKNRTNAFFAAALFAVYPVHVESVTWISGVTEPLLAMLFVSSVLSYFRWRDSGSKRWCSISLAFYVLALLAKETAVMLVPMIWCYEWFRQRESGTSARMRMAGVIAAPYGVVAIAFLVVRAMVLKGIAPDVGNHASPTTLLLTLPAALYFYLAKLLWPLPLSVFYPFAFITKASLMNFVWPSVVLIAVGAGLYLWSRHQSEVISACLWLVLPILPPVFAIVRFVPSDLVHDRYLYLPSIGFCMLLAMGLGHIRFGTKSIGGVPVTQAACLLLLVFVFGGETVAESHYWSDSLLLYQHGVEVALHSVVALHQLAALMSQQGNYAAARRYLEQSLETEPDDYQNLVSAGVVSIYLRDYDRAIPYLLHATQVKPDQGTAFFYLGMVQLAKQRKNEAEASFTRAIALLPRSPRQHYALGLVLEDEGRIPEARQEFLEELKLDPDSNARDRLLELEPTSASVEQPSQEQPADTDVWKRIIENTHSTVVGE